MPVGIIIWAWDERVGPTILAKYPKEIEISQKTMIQLVFTATL